jgi:hypothetical protein
MCRVFTEHLIVTLFIKEISYFCETQRFITVFIKAWTLSWVEPFSPYFSNINFSNIILFVSNSTSSFFLKFSNRNFIYISHLFCMYKISHSSHCPWSDIYIYIYICVCVYIVIAVLCSVKNRMLSITVHRTVIPNQRSVNCHQSVNYNSCYIKSQQKKYNYWWLSVVVCIYWC